MEVVGFWVLWVFGLLGFNPSTCLIRKAGFRNSWTMALYRLQIPRGAVASQLSNQNKKPADRFWKPPEKTFFKCGGFSPYENLNPPP